MGNSCSGGDRHNKGAAEGVALSKEEIFKLDKEGYNDRDHGRVAQRTIFSADRTPTDSITAGIATCGPKREGQPACSGGNLGQHRHLHSEVLFFISGEGIVNIDMIEHEVQAGSAVFVPAGAEHSVRNESLVDELSWYYCFAADQKSEVRWMFTTDTARPL